MRPLKITVSAPLAIQECYLYGGNLFLVFKDATLRTISLKKILAKLFKSRNDKQFFYELAFLRNNWYNNEQANNFFNIEGYKSNFHSIWLRYVTDLSIVSLDLDELDFLCELPTMPIFDLRLYGMRLFIGNRDGLYDLGININSYNGEVAPQDKLERVFDARTTHLNAKTGSLLVSSNSDGLFHGKLLNINEKIRVADHAIRSKSLRTAWSGYDVVNYETQANFNYLQTEYEKVEQRSYRFSSSDEDAKKIQITEIGTSSIRMEDMFYNHSDLIDQITFTFNSSRSCYFVLNDGTFFNTYFKKDNNLRLSSRFTELPKQNKNNAVFKKPTSGNVISDGCVLEYANSVYLIQNQKGILLEDKPVVAVRTYPNSIRYKNIISIVNKEGVNLYSAYPFHD